MSNDLNFDRVVLNKSKIEYFVKISTKYDNTYIEERFSKKWLTSEEFEDYRNFKLPGRLYSF